MAISVVQHTHSGQGANNSVSQAFGSNVAAGNLIVVGVFVSTGIAVTFSCSDNLSNSYTNAVQKLGVGPGEALVIFYAKNVSGGACTVTGSTTQTSTFPIVHIYEISGCDTAAPLDQTGSANNEGAPVYTVSTSATTTSANEYVFGFFGLGSAGNDTTAPAPRTAIDGGTDAEVFNGGAFNVKDISLDYIVSATGILTATSAWNTLDGGGTAVIATFKAASTSSTHSLMLMGCGI